VLKAGCALASAAALALAGGAAGALRTGPGDDWVSATLSSARAGARPVTLKLSIHTALQCGRLVGGALVIRLPAQELVPKAVPARAVLVGGSTSGGVVVSGHTLTVAIPRPSGVLCDVIAPGTVVVRLTRAANLGNPARAGSYPLIVQRGRLLLRTRFTVR